MFNPTACFSKVSHGLAQLAFEHLQGKKRHHNISRLISGV